MQSVIAIVNTLDIAKSARVLFKQTGTNEPHINLVHNLVQEFCIQLNT